MTRYTAAIDMRAYQWRTADTVRRNVPGCALFVDMGLGKTVIVLTAVADMLRTGEIRAVLVLGSINVIETVWRQEAKLWDHVEHLRFSLVRGTAKQRAAALETPADLYLVNFENIKWLFDHLKGRFPFDMLVVDESSAFKVPGTVRFRTMRYAVKHFSRRVILTGTPRPNTLKNIWPQIYLLDEGARLGTAFGRFESRFFVPTDYMGYHWEPRPGAEEQIHALIAPITVRLDRKDYLTLPPVVYNRVKVVLPEPARVMYREFERKMFLALEGDEELEAVNAAVLVGKCMQIANGAVYTTPDPEQPALRKVAMVHDAKLEALNTIFEETGTPMLVAYQYEHDLARLKQWRDAPHIGGKQETPTAQIVAEWNAGKHPVLYVHPASASHGLNMQYGGHTLVFFSLTWSAEHRSQLIARLDRSGQQFPVVVHDIVAENTIDEVIIAAVDAKLRGQAEMLHALNTYRIEKERLE